ncbi:Crp/Fnr family transcriptional regulator [Lichenibacterium dinghuense]|uniref:Crp/Fnr family transcriptional regulator n=1 Tax=Lichenibacterium dinghuense TaxID=2895977 RepID=UPI001F393591|nr:Crp/Fnr family transcriptional regulator [Lichenibacterium sp. 6Y81]
MADTRDTEGKASILWRFSLFIDLTPGETRALLSLIDAAKSFPSGSFLHRQGEEPSLFFLHEGWVVSGIDVARGDRQILKVHRAGDVLGSPSLPFARAVETLTALTPCRASAISRKAVGALFDDWPRVAAALFAACQVERVVLMDRLVAVGRLDAADSFVAFLIQLFRTRPPGATGNSIHLPLTQPQIGDVLGLSPVHVNRVINRLEQDGLIRRDGYTYDLLDLPRLEARAAVPRRVPERSPAWFPPARA